MTSLQWWMMVAATAALCHALPDVGRVLLWLISVASIFAGCSRSTRTGLLTLSSAGTWGALIGLSLLLMTDRFEIRYVWLYSSPDLPLTFKAANVWGGDEGIAMALAAFSASLSVLESRTWKPRVSVSALLVTVLSVLAASMNPFGPTPDELLSKATSQGMNAHLMNQWMLLHAPLIIAAYSWSLALIPPSIEVLAGAANSWPQRAYRNARLAWFLLTAGIGFGMAWAFEDATFGQVWHWDPVQTSVFVVWCFLTAHLHYVGGLRTERHPLTAASWTGLGVGVFTLCALSVTRSDQLASSHRYVGSYAGEVYFFLGLLVFGAGVVSFFTRLRRAITSSSPRYMSTSALAVRLMSSGLVLMATIAMTHLIVAFLRSAYEVEKPEELRPYFATATKWVQTADAKGLITAYNLWEVDSYALVRLVIPVLVLVGLVGGWYFVRRISKPTSNLLTAFVICAALYLFVSGGYLSQSYSGTGVLSQKIVSVLPWLDTSLLTGLYLAAGCIAWGVWSAARCTRGAYRVVSVCLIHVGVGLALWGGVVSTCLNSYSQHVVGEGGDWHDSRTGHAFRLRSVSVAREPDGGQVSASGQIRTAAEVDLIARDGTVVSGQTLYRDTRPSSIEHSGPMRAICQILDYRYARFANRPGHILHPFIDHGLSRDVQIWVDPAAAMTALERADEAVSAVLIIRTFPWISLLWVGVSMMSAGSLILIFRETWISIRGGR